MYSRFKDFADRYCEVGRFGYSGCKNADELHACLTSQLMIRRMKAAVLTQLPPKVRQQVMLPVDNLPGMAKIQQLRHRLETVRCRALTRTHDTGPLELGGGHFTWKIVLRFSLLLFFRFVLLALRPGTDAKSTCGAQLDAVVKQNDDGGEVDGARQQSKQLMNELYTESAKAKQPVVQEYMLTLLDSDAEAKFLFFAHHKCLLDAVEQVRSVCTMAAAARPSTAAC